MHALCIYIFSTHLTPQCQSDDYKSFQNKKSSRIFAVILKSISSRSAVRVLLHGTIFDPKRGPNTFLWRFLCEPKAIYCTLPQLCIYIIYIFLCDEFTVMQALYCTCFSNPHTLFVFLFFISCLFWLGNVCTWACKLTLPGKTTDSNDKFLFKISTTT